TLFYCLTTGITPLLVGRVFQGVGRAGIMVLSLVIFTDIVPLCFRSKCIVFYAIFPFYVAGLLLLPSISSLKAPFAMLLEKFRRIDWIGGSLFILSGTVFLVAILWGGIQYSWLSPGTIIPLCLRNVSLIVTYICGIIQGLIIYGQLYYILLYFLAVKAYNPIQTGLSTLPIMVTLVPSSMVTGALVTLGSFLTVLFNRNMLTIIWATVLIILSLGHGAVLNAQNFAAQAIYRQGKKGPAAAMYAFMRQFGMALGVYVGSTVFQNSKAFVKELQKMPSKSLKKLQVLDAYIYGLRGVYLLYSSLSGTAFLISLFLRHCKMAGKVISAH
ncbi:major facilitator superfamily domain-containing protein, partial [Diaporthe sp. PMI_573]